MHNWLIEKIEKIGEPSGAPGNMLNFGTSGQARVPLKVVLFLRERRATAMRRGSGFARPRAGFKGSRPPSLSQPDAVLSSVSSNDRGDAGCYAAKAAVGESGMAVISDAPLRDRHQSKRELSIVGSLFEGVPKGVLRFTEPLSSYGSDVHAPPRGEWNSSPFWET